VTVATEVAKYAHQLEYFLCIEGLGWPTNISDLTQGFDGTVFATGDLNGDLATVLGCTIKQGLNMPRSISEKMDPRELKYESGSMGFSVVDVDDVLISNVRPHAPGTTSTINADLTYSSTTVQIDNATTSYATGDEVWLGGSEFIKLGTKASAGGTVYNYNGSTRGYLGTKRGKRSRSPVGGATIKSGFTWQQGTTITQFNRYWFDRRILLFAHVPGETVGNVIRLYTGRLRTIRLGEQGIQYEIGTASDNIDNNHEVFDPPGELVVSSCEDQPWGLTNQNVADSDYEIANGQVGVNAYTGFSYERRFKIEVVPKDGGSDIYTGFYPAFAYHYRRVAGGTEGALKTAFATGSPADPQALERSDPEFHYVMGGIVKIGDTLTRARGKFTQGTGRFNAFEVARAAYDLGTDRIPAEFESGTQIKFCLDNYTDDFEINRFSLNNVVSRNPIDVLLCFLTTMNSEFVVEDTHASSPGTTTTINFASTIGTTNQWAGYALHATEDSNIGESRLILSNTTTSITVAAAFSNTPTASKEYQVRNSLYDVLPLGWGMNVENFDIDISSFETVRDQHLNGANLGRFVLLPTTQSDLWKLLVENICKPYNLFIYQERATGKIKCEYIGETIQDGLITSYTTVGENQIINMGSIDLIPRSAVGQIVLETRPHDTQVTRTEIRGDRWNRVETQTTSMVSSPGIDSDPYVITIRSDELDSVIDRNLLGNLKLSAMFNDASQISDLAAKQVARLKREATPPAEVDLVLDIGFLTSIQVGTLISVTDQGTFKPFNPYTANRGFNGTACRVLSCAIELGSEPSMRVRVQILKSGLASLIAPAVIVSSYSSGVFSIDVSQYAPEDGEAWDSLGVGDRLELRDKLGAYKAGPLVISSFGANLSTTPAGASTDVINITTTPSLTIATDDYLTFSSYSASNTSNMNKFAAMANDSTKTLTGGDQAKVYL